jgi:hypothetical protein
MGTSGIQKLSLSQREVLVCVCVYVCVCVCVCRLIHHHIRVIHESHFGVYTRCSFAE